ncbi:AAA domain (dynein-related subfamily) [Amycolatopsis xylanica]|uniref:AAA domain (Dynein-related subfamily) n=1 Tax=Amycolatopsis xylanica TaxID=589385 RepID=A0A1H3NMR5_9PSEU|nr:MoxR family ATPase [Amycolatopsis xylanica]SDY89970.1 AAA domain (dynein-related subfamily) [Amycolatopsis xylanica]
MTWTPAYRGDGVERGLPLPAAPPWRTFPRSAVAFQPPAGLAEAVNAALALRRPLLITGAPGTGKSTAIESVATELKLGPVLRWQVTSQSTLSDALYRYDALGRIHAHQLGSATDDITTYLRLGPLGTALLPSDHPRALLIDDIDKGDLDLTGDLAEVLEDGEFEIPELVRFERDAVEIRESDGEARHVITRGRVVCTEFPFIVLTSNGERDFSSQFLRRCVRFTMPSFTDPAAVRRVLEAHFGLNVDDAGPLAELIDEFATRVQAGESLAIDQLLAAAHLLTGEHAPHGEDRRAVLDYVLRELTRA